MIGIFVYITWCTYCLLEGMRDAWMYNIRDFTRVNGLNEHYIFSAQRALVLGILAYVWWPMIILGPMAFSFLHNGMYYWSRNALDERIYTKKWFDQSSTSTAKSTNFFTPQIRTVFFVLSLIILTIIHYAIWNKI